MSAAAAFTSFPSRRAASASIQGSNDGGVEIVEEQQQVREVALRVDGDDRDALAQQLLEEDDGEAGLARAGHADDEPVGQQVGGVELEPRAGLAAVGVDLLSEIEPVAHRASLSACGAVYAASHAGGAVSSPEVGARPRSRPQSLVHEPLASGPAARHACCFCQG